MVNEDKIITVELLLKERVGDKLNNLSKRVQNFANGVDKVNRQTSRLSSTLSGIRAELLSVGLAFLFTGMALQRFFKGLITSTVKVYREMVDGQTAVAESLTRLEAGWMFLKVTVGEAIATALQPLVPLFLSIINTVANWIDQHPRLTGAIIILGAAIGSLMLVLGMFLLFMNGILGVLTYFGIEAAAAGAGATGAFTSILAPIFAVIAGILIVIGVVKLMSSFWKDSSASMDKATSQLISGIKNIGLALIAVFSDDTELAGAYFRAGIEQMVKSMVTFGRAIVEIFINMIDIGVRPFIDAILLGLKLMDMLTGGNVADVARAKLLGGLESILGGAREGVASRLNTNIQTAGELELQRLLMQREQATQAFTETRTDFNIAELNITIPEVSGIDQLREELERSVGPQLQIS